MATFQLPVGAGAVVNDTGATGTVIDNLTSVSVNGTTGPLTLNLGSGGNFAKNLVLGTAGSLQALHGEVDINGPATGSEPLTLDDSADTTARTIAVATVANGFDSVTGIAPAAIKFTAGDFALTLNAGGGGNTIGVSDLGGGAAMTVNAGAGNDTINVSVSGMGGFSPLSVNGQGGSNTLTAAGSGDAPAIGDDPSTTTPGSGILEAIYPAPLPTRNINYANISTLPNILNATTTTLTTTAPSGFSYYSTPFTLSATVAGLVSGQATPTGAVTFLDTTTNTTLGIANLINGVATITTALTSSLFTTHAIVAAYSGDSTNTPSSATLSTFLTSALTTTTITASTNPITAGQSSGVPRRRSPSPTVAPQFRTGRSNLSMVMGSGPPRCP